MELWADLDGFGLVQVVEVGAKSSVIATRYPDVNPIRFQVESRGEVEAPEAPD